MAVCGLIAVQSVDGRIVGCHQLGQRALARIGMVGGAEHVRTELVVGRVRGGRGRTTSTTYRPEGSARWRARHRSTERPAWIHAVARQVLGGGDTRGRSGLVVAGHEFDLAADHAARLIDLVDRDRGAGELIAADDFLRAAERRDQAEPDRLALREARAREAPETRSLRRRRARDLVIWRLVKSCRHGFPPCVILSIKR